MHADSYTASVSGVAQRVQQVVQRLAQRLVFVFWFELTGRSWLKL
jgi:hypothetical protein